MPVDHVERQLREAWGSVDGVLDELDPEPVAVRPGGQVHRGVHDGAPVAVKVRRPGLAPVVRGDLVLVEQAARMVAGAAPGIDVAGLLRELRERTLDEFDLEHEASVQRSFARALRSSGRFVVGRPDSELSAETVLVTPWVEGTPVVALVADDQGETQGPRLGQAPSGAQAPPAAVRLGAAQALVAFHLGAGRSGTVHADPDPRDALLTPDGRLAILDFGATAQVSAQRVGLATATLDALAQRDGPGLARALDALGWLPGASADDGAVLLRVAERVLGPFLDGPALLDLDAVGDIMERAGQAAEPQATALVQRTAVQPQDLWPLRGLGQLVLALAPLGVEADWLTLGREALAHGWDGA
ncbi:MAG: AarF/ABC1/UbiB kinase family protein [Solirubrobacteraceae bacterium MAG38_C4-C5]|nr:AarF/ABC1/UbiB kinase family protein [Candidatus Siliceabacter maunaloa]